MDLNSESIASRVSRLKQAAEKANLERLKAQARLELAQKAEQKARETLKEVYGVGTVEEATELLKTKRKELEGLASEVEEILNVS